MKSVAACLLIVACVNAVYIKHDDSNSYASVVKHEDQSLKYDNDHHHYGNYYAKGSDHDYYNDYSSNPNYEYKYGVKDLKTGDIKDAWESRHGDVVKGSYTLKEADGTTRVVEYTADKHNGFNAVVKNVGYTNGHHQPEQFYKHKEMPSYTTYDKYYY